ncbi:MAG: hypothetical protein JRG73_11185 [Deltaproteobacteria bacterium]|nr:hypothetical protein [Deltaproteobacteria bacterium]
MPVRQSWFSTMRKTSGPVQMSRRVRPVEVNRQDIGRWKQIDERLLNPGSGAISRIYRPSAAGYRSPPPPLTPEPRVAKWFHRLYSALPQRPVIDWERFQQELYAPAVRAVRVELRKALPELENRDIYSGIEGASSWSRRARTRAFSDAARIIGDLRSKAGVRRKEAEMRRASRERTEALGLLRLASEMASREAGAKNTARMGAWRIGEQARTREVLRKNAATSDILRTLLGAALNSGNAGAVSRLVMPARRMPG